MHWRRNGDVNIRELERRAAAGDEEARHALANARLRSGQIQRTVQAVAQDLQRIDPRAFNQVYEEVIGTLLAVENSGREPVVRVWEVLEDSQGYQRTWGTYRNELRAYQAVFESALEGMEGFVDDEVIEQIEALILEDHPDQALALINQAGEVAWEIQASFLQ